MERKETVSAKHFLGGLLSAIVLCAVMGAATTPASPSSGQARNTKPRTESAGERVFQQNCARCHTAPESFSPRISGTIVRHMRVRASLSQHDEKELLKYLNP